MAASHFTGKSAIAILILLVITETKSSAIDFPSQDDKDRFQQLQSLQLEMKSKLAKLTTADEIPAVLKLYQAKAQYVLAKPLAIRINWGESVDRLLFSARSMRIFEADINEDSYELQADINVSIVARNAISKSIVGNFSVKIDNKDYLVRGFSFLNQDGTVLSMKQLFYDPVTPIQPNDVVQLRFYSVPINVLSEAHTIVVQ